MEKRIAGKCLRWNLDAIFECVLRIENGKQGRGKQCPIFMEFNKEESKYNNSYGTLLTNFRSDFERFQKNDIAPTNNTFIVINKTLIFVVKHTVRILGIYYYCLKVNLVYYSCWRCVMVYMLASSNYVSICFC